LPLPILTMVCLGIMWAMAQSSELARREAGMIMAWPQTVLSPPPIDYTFTIMASNRFTAMACVGSDWRLDLEMTWAHFADG
jgi:hypothetical protein